MQAGHGRPALYGPSSQIKSRKALPIDLQQFPVRFDLLPDDAFATEQVLQRPVGFGGIEAGEDSLHFRKWGIRYSGHFPQPHSRLQLMRLRVAVMACWALA